ncbi:uncharacterized protein LOC143619496 [Bidens hawaiensis]|uniref:uncharacterized protein LOC143619496 n=1 Tax=Bidens hawaiensis TaxID=980011 RepID=UPI00404B3344
MKGLRISRAKTEYLQCDFGGVTDDEEVHITIEGQVVPQVTKFKYLGSFVHSDGKIDSDVAHRVQIVGLSGDTFTKVGGSRDENVKVDVWETRLDRIRNDAVRERLGVTCIPNKIREGRLRWFGHVKRRQMTAHVRLVENITIEGNRGRGRPKLT